SREVIVKIAALHNNKKALDIFAREIAKAATGMAPGLTGILGGRPKSLPRIRLFSTLVPKHQVQGTVDISGDKIAVSQPAGQPLDSKALADHHRDAARGEIAVPLVKLAWARSGDKGKHANIGVIARQAAYLPYLRN